MAITADHAGHLSGLRRRGFGTCSCYSARASWPTGSIARSNNPNNHSSANRFDPRISRMCRHHTRVTHNSMGGKRSVLCSPTRPAMACSRLAGSWRLLPTRLAMACSRLAGSTRLLRLALACWRLAAGSIAVLSDLLGVCPAASCVPLVARPAASCVRLGVRPAVRPARPPCLPDGPSSLRARPRGGRTSHPRPPRTCTPPRPSHRDPNSSYCSTSRPWRPQP